MEKYDLIRTVLAFSVLFLLLLDVPGNRRRYDNSEG